ncbi:MAG: sensor histidine kinase [Cyclobacteriaceae bacterium]|nr:sensor histidine kinase [Cyclobacteriaceae bacterium]
MKNFLLVFCTLLVVITFFSCERNDFGKSRIIPIKSGKLDLENYDLSTQSPLILNGEWELYWNKLLTPNDFENNFSLIPDTIIYFPSYWNNLEWDGKEYERGYATYRLKIYNVRNSTELAIKMRNALTAYKLWVNDKLLIENGKVGATDELTSPGYFPEIQMFNIKDSTLQITLQISNFTHAKGGMRGDIVLGETNKVFQVREKSIIFEMFLIGSIFIMSIYHFGLYFLSRNNISTLYFGSLCLVVVIRILYTGEMIVNNYYNFSWEITQKLEYLTYIATLPLFLLFVKSLYPKQFSKTILNVLVGVGLVLVLLTIVTPSSIFSYIADPYQFIIIIGGLYVFYVLYKSIKTENENLSQSVIFLIGYVILFITVIYDIFYYQFLFQRVYLAPFGLFIFIFSQSFLLSKRFSAAFKMVEVYSTSLEVQVNERTVELQQKNKSLEHLNKEKDSMIDIVAHDLKSPFNNILGLIHLTKLSSQLEGEQKKYINQMEKVVEGGVGLIHDILDIHAYNYEDFELNLEKIELGKFINDWKQRYVHMLIEKNQKLHIDVEDNIDFTTDYRVFSRIIDNLLTNAIKFSKRDKNIWIIVSVKKDMLEVIVKDEGPGLSEEDQKLMYKRFQKLSPKPTGGESSNGLGLSIIKTLVNKLSGEINLISEVGKGSSFYVLLPMNFSKLS